ncbi:hypothetical protein EX30DRAFT_358366 [Ascodesmis nigricans]|uniref:Uncharacterized protein n=1 Tax=Ascodesmis nigricans TaxID=341454 RepID=A0A4S2N0A8_9PEZI|nr:hypothetical protein EX30DRAFT_358366 [Ascodesmis nigricans]
MKLSSKFPAELIIKARVIKLALNQNGVEKSRKSMRRDVFRKTQFSDQQQKSLWTQMSSSGTVNELIKFAKDDTDAQVMQWLEKQLEFSSWPEKRFVKMQADSIAKTMKKDFQRDFPLFSKDILKRCLQKLKKPGSRNTDRPDPVNVLGPDAAGVLQEAELVGVTHKYFVDDKSPKEVSETQNEALVAAITNTLAGGPGQIPFYHEFFGPDGRRIIEQIQIPIIKDMRGTAEVTEASSDINAPVQEHMEETSTPAQEHVEETSDPVMQEVQKTPGQKTTESKKEKKKRLKEEMAARLKQEYEDMGNQYWEAEEEEDRWGKSRSRFGDEDLPAPSNPKVEGSDLFSQLLGQTS